MKCPKCVSADLETKLGPKGSAVDLCPSCEGVWLDNGEVYLYAKDPQGVFGMLKEAYAKGAPSPRVCPRDQSRLVQVRPGGSSLVIDACPVCGGDWFDKGEIQQLNALLSKKVDAKDARPAPMPEVPKLEKRLPPSEGMTGPLLPPLPNLAIRSGGVLFGLYGILVAFFAGLSLFLKMDIGWAFLAAGLGLVLNFLLGPTLMDWSLGWMHRFRWVSPQELPGDLKPFLERLCLDERIPIPRCGIIEDGSPNAFTYGHYPGNARLVLTRGLIDLLDEEELKAVVAHEVGHITHWDMAVMTLAALVPAILYVLYKACMKASRGRSSGRKGGNPLPLIGLAALLLYFITEYVVLFLSRTREYYADRFAGAALRAPGRLASALVKIAYGLAGRREEKREEEQTLGLSAVRSFGVFDPVGARGLVASSLVGTQGQLSKQNITAAMQWDLWNPWAGFFELSSTHPLPAKRIEALGRQAESMGKEPFVRFDLKQPESYWDEFLVDILVLYLPWTLALAGALAWALVPGALPLKAWYWNVLAFWGVGYLFRAHLSYPRSDVLPASAASLLKQVKVSGVRGIRVKLSGKIIGRGIPGYLLSEDLVLQDKTGFLTLDYRQPMAFLQWIFALSAAGRLVGQEVEAEGWYRRAPVPYLELRSLRGGGQQFNCYTLPAKFAFGGLLVAAAVFLGLGW